MLVIVKIKSIVIILFLANNLISQKQFFLIDSTNLSSPTNLAYLQDVYYLNNQLWARFDEWNVNGNDVFLVSPKKYFKFSTRDSNILMGPSNLFGTDLGFIIPKYNREKIMFFDTINGQLIIDKSFNHQKISSKTIVPFVNEVAGYNAFTNLRTDISYTYPFLLFNCITWTYDENSKKISTLKRSIKRIFKKNKSFLLFDIQKKKVINTFGKYPSIYLKEYNNVVNMNHYFVTDEKSKITYSSYQADENITIYAINGDIIGLIKAPGKLVNKERLSLSIFNREVVKRKILYNSFCDSYENVYLFNDKLFRIYNLALPVDSLANWLPETSSPRCIPYQTEIEWLNIILTKPRYLQQISLDGKEIYEFPFPTGVNTFVGYDSKQQIYYFRKQKLGIGNIPQGSTIIYAFKLE